MTGNRVFSVALAVVLLVGSSASAQTTSSEPVYRHAGFARGDSNADGALNIGDAMALFSNLFLGVGVLPCEAAGDADANARLNVGDGLFILNHLALGGAAPTAPYPECDAGATGGLACATESCPEAAGRSFTLFGETFEADSVVFAIGRSSIIGGNVFARRRVAEEIKGALAGLPEALPFDVVYFDGKNTVSLAPDAAPSIVMSTSQVAANSTIDQLFETRHTGDDLGALLHTAIQCARRGTGEERAVIYLGDGWDLSFGEPSLTEPVDPRLRAATVDVITNFNATDPVTIHTIGLSRITRALRAMMAEIAGQNDGTYTTGGQVILPVAGDNLSC